ncbi:poly-beta-1,6-N-acetyl-D-glucosamine biosynthesis protein PgaD [Xenorhabdus griffiniae]|uniref:Poly-beta-1,6-N-acetyl-D-glucosamine biosynthesis protein PgaD n=1 Tax=Xenorhabdus griffiniae TaxID=351672 RepID=A0ABY9XLI7_9GAMM|nr:poly-beta-1,6-N-acetyl-D-glucosamine biosynthesis protein PgaD [Xenorhabdus griffiniae]MBD1226208.1 poly-beta-1,6-N-acetyl-D-glucosamine biosynthesis protein PgaD [Xenorhabdus griffiniae]MBE8586446.1 poly-beta-1,6-N-acetyl-D-glucosamine biosynthesis protein PgaD [Xenorhabdus griffiniae]MDC9605904.1 poly-beta-1,6-N-acetyl-D-glucosamine biosynthesis protein PgaD [Xenorhabdus griffiniae]WMV73803.1 poly-beta-1,6-N-acetyl-D-glucosamine biosynthesis protein PgaD [Xenorhabdus griffiniae]WNH03484.1
MKEPLIFTEQRLWPRLIDILLTVLAWVGFIYLFMVGLFYTSHNGPRPFTATVFTSELGTITLYIGIAIFNAFLLIGWAKYNQRRFRIERRRHRPALTHTEVAQSFTLEQKLFDTLRQSKVSSITYDNHGHIIGIDEDVSIYTH